jgi:hypothetical protein
MIDQGCLMIHETAFFMTVFVQHILLQPLKIIDDSVI